MCQCLFLDCDIITKVMEDVRIGETESVIHRNYLYYYSTLPLIHNYLKIKFMKTNSQSDENQNIPFITDKV